MTEFKKTNTLVTLKTTNTLYAFKTTNTMYTFQTTNGARYLLYLQEVQDWKFIAMVMDRLFLYIFTTACFSGTLSIFLYAPSLYDHREPMELIDMNSSCRY